MPRRRWAARPRRQVSATYHGSLTHLRVGARERYHKLSGYGLTRSSNVTKATGGGCAGGRVPGALVAVPRLGWRGARVGRAVSLAAVPRSRRPPRPGQAAGHPRRVGSREAGLAAAGLAGAAAKQASPKKA